MPIYEDREHRDKMHRLRFLMDQEKEDSILREIARVENQILEIHHRKKVAAMPKEQGYSLWCDPGNHAFSQKDPEMEQIVRPGKGAYEDDNVLTMCGEHNIFKPANKVQAALPCMESEKEGDNE